jgi:hypothetical protein
MNRTNRHFAGALPQPSKDGIRLPGGLELDPVGTVRIQKVRQPQLWSRHRPKTKSKP